MYYNSSYDALASVLGAFSIFTMLACVAILIALIVANWKIFEKASQPGWASIVPFYRKRRKTPCFSYGNIRRSETKFFLKG